MSSIIINENTVVRTNEYEIKSFEVNANNEIKPFVLLHYLEDMAYSQAEELHFGYTDIYPRGYAWFVTKYHMSFKELPKAWDNIKIKTWPCKNGGIQCRRDFEIFNNQNEIIGVVSSAWVLINVNSKKIVNPYKTLEFPPLSETHALETNFAKIHSLTRIDFEKQFEIRFDDIDLNKHVNNSNYIAWATETVPYDFRIENSTKEIEISYKKEATYGMPVISQVEINRQNNISLHMLKDGNNQEELAAIKIQWVKHNN